VTRALVSAVLVLFGLLPLLVTAEDKNDYFRALMAVSFQQYTHHKHIDQNDLTRKADADGSNLAPLAKFIARQQLQAFFLSKTQIPPPSQVQSSEFRRLRIAEANRFIQQKASDVAASYKRTVNMLSQGPSLIVVSHGVLQILASI
jgi:predicted component of type VI protein secretion system